MLASGELLSASGALPEQPAEVVDLGLARLLLERFGLRLNDPAVEVRERRSSWEVRHLPEPDADGVRRVAAHTIEKPEADRLKRPYHSRTAVDPDLAVERRPEGTGDAYRERPGHWSDLGSYDLSASCAVDAFFLQLDARRAVAALQRKVQALPADSRARRFFERVVELDREHEPTDRAERAALVNQAAADVGLDRRRVSEIREQLGRAVPEWLTLHARRRKGKSCP